MVLEVVVFGVVVGGDYGLWIVVYVYGVGGVEF